MLVIFFASFCNYYNFELTDQKIQCRFRDIAKLLKLFVKILEENNVTRSCSKLIIKF